MPATMPAILPTDLPPCAPLLEGLTDPTMLVGADRRILMANAAARELFAANVLGAPILTYIRQPDAVTALERGFAALASGEHPAQPFEAKLIKTAQGQETVLRVQVTPLSKDFGVPSMLVGLRDISHIEDAEQQRRDFVANVSHELRSPLTVLAGFIETLQGPARNDPEAQEKFLDIMDREAQRMNRLVSDLLSLSRVESEERVRPRERVAVSDVVLTTIAALRPQIEDAGLVVEFHDLADAPSIAGDRDQLVQVFHNLIENAVKYGQSGNRIDVAIERIDTAPGMNGPALRVDVQDYGEGIDAIHLPRLTERFYRIDGHRSRTMGGTGLGLAIVKHIINRHRGRFSVRSTRGEGSTFSVLLPIG